MQTFFAYNAIPLHIIRNHIISLTRYGFTREELLWMPISEMFDYIQIINSKIEEENKSNASPIEKSETPTINDVFKGRLMF